MKIVYIAHPINGDVEGNKKKIAEIGRQFYEKLPEYIPIAPYFFDLAYLNDSLPHEREKGIANNQTLLMCGFIDELWLFGNRITEGMKQEIQIAIGMDIKVLPADPRIKDEYLKLFPDTPFADVALEVAND